MNFNNLTYIYQSGRISRLDKNEEYPEEFFYGLASLKNKFRNTTVIELKDSKKTTFKHYFFYFLRKISGLPIYSEQLIFKDNIKKIKQSDLIVLSNQRMGFSALPFIFMNKSNKTQISCVFVMGLYNVNTKKRIKILIRKLFTFFFIRTIDKIIFLSEGEYLYSIKKYKNYKNKFVFLPFCIDTNFWNAKKTAWDEKKHILFMGNDGMRDYNFVIDLAKSMPEYNFTFVTKKINKSEIKSKNVKLYNGFWSEEILSDKDIREIYKKSLVSIIPINESFQPSGQSVALQSMSMEIPVIITKTSGFWEPNVYKDEKNILFVNKNDIEIWKNKILSLLNNEEKRLQIIKEARKTVLENNNLENFNNELNKIFFN